MILKLTAIWTFEAPFAVSNISCTLEQAPQDTARPDGDNIFVVHLSLFQAGCLYSVKSQSSGSVLCCICKLQKVTQTIFGSPNMSYSLVVTAIKILCGTHSNFVSSLCLIFRDRQ